MSGAPDPIHNHPTVQGLLATIRLHRVLLVVVVVIAFALAGVAAWDHLIKAASDFG